MKKLALQLFIFSTISVALLSCMSRATAKKESSSINVADSIKDKIKIALPLDYEEWQNSDAADNSDTRVGDYRSYPSYYIEDSKWLDSIFHAKNRADTTLGMYLILDQKSVQFESFVLLVGVKNGSFFKILNISPEGNIISEMTLSCMFLRDANDNLVNENVQQGFTITPDMKINTYEGSRFNYYESLQRGIIENKKSTGLYQIKEDGTIVKIEQS